MPKYWGKQIFSLGRIPEVGAKDGKDKREKKDRKLVITMASYALQRHLGWHTQSRLGQKIRDRQADRHRYFLSCCATKKHVLQGLTHYKLVIHIWMDIFNNIQIEYLVAENMKVSLLNC